MAYNCLCHTLAALHSPPLPDPTHNGSLIPLIRCSPYFVLCDQFHERRDRQFSEDKPTNF